MRTKSLIIEATVKYKCNGFSKDKNGTQYYSFTVLLDNDYTHLAPSGQTTVRCTFNNLKFKWGPIGIEGTKIRINGYFVAGSRNGNTLHIEAIEVLEIAPKKLTNVSAKQLKQWAKCTDRSRPVPNATTL